MEKEFIPLNNNVLIKKYEAGKKKEQDGFILKETTNEKTIPEGIVKAIDSEIDFLECGDEVVFNPNSSYEFILNNEEFVITNSENIFGKLKNK